MTRDRIIHQKNLSPGEMEHIGELNRVVPVDGLRLFNCLWCNREFTREDLEKISMGELTHCPVCLSMITGMKRTTIQDPAKNKTAGVSDV
jgi:DNA-directed RNA polymerase subunit RPC12/RpoP